MVVSVGKRRYLLLHLCVSLCKALHFYVIFSIDFLYISMLFLVFISFPWPPLAGGREIYIVGKVGTVGTCRYLPALPMGITSFRET